MASSTPTAAPFSAVSFTTLAPRRSANPISPPRRPDTPQLSLREYRKFQQSPLLSASSERDLKRVRRVAATTDLTDSISVQTAAAQTLGNSSQPPLIHSSAHVDLLPPFLPSPLPPPTTPQQRRAATASPSLSSTVDTLQSTSTYSPLWRDTPQLDQERSLQQLQLNEPVRTKRKFPALRQAKRLPRPEHGGGSNGSSSGSTGEPYLVYAAVFDPSGNDRYLDAAQLKDQDFSPAHDFSDVEFVESTSHRPRQQSRIRGLPGPRHPGSIGTPADSTGHRERELAATSALSLSRFEFPVPPSHDNWGSADHIADVSTSSTPATLLYYGTSFDVVNPHASLLLETHDFETPAEIDGLLDDYFEQKSEGRESMKPNHLANEGSQQLLVTGSESSRHVPRRLYGDATSARRNILRVDDNLASPSRALVNESPLSHKLDSSLGFPKAFKNASSPAPLQHTHDSPSIPSVDSVINFVKEEVERYESSMELINRGTSASNAASEARPPTSLMEKASEVKRSLSNKTKKAKKKKKYRSDPFDLTLSDCGDEKCGPPGNDSAKQRIECEPFSEDQDGGLPSSFSGQGCTTHADPDEHNTDPIVRDILNGYDYTREQAGPENHQVFLHSPSLEQDAHYEHDRNDSVVQSPMTSQGNSLDPFEDDTYPALVKCSASPPSLGFPTPPAPVYGGSRHHHWEFCSDLPTIERTYGETNQLLAMTSEAASTGHKNRNSMAYREEPHEEAQAAVVRQSEYRRLSYDKFTTPPSPSVEVARAHFEDTEPTPSESNLSPGQECYKLSPDTIRRQLRSSSIYADDCESAWETQRSTSDVDLPHELERASEESFANTSTLSGHKHLPGVDPGISSSFSIEQTSGSELHNSPDDTEKKAAERMKILLEDKILNENLNHIILGGPAPDKEQRKKDCAELERLRKQYPSRFGRVAEEHRQKVKHRISLMKTGSASSFQKIQDAMGKGKGKKSKAHYDPRRSFNKAADIGLSIRGNAKDPASDRRQLLNPSPSPTFSGLQWSDSLNTMVTTGEDSPYTSRKEMYGKVPEFWSPFMGDPTTRVLNSQNLESPFHPVNSGAMRPSTYNPRGTRAAINGQKGLHGLTLKPSKTSRLAQENETYELQFMKPIEPNRSRVMSTRGLSDDELIQRSAGWKSEPNLTANGALGKYANQPDVRSRGLFMPRLGKRNCRVDPGNPMGDGGKGASAQIKLHSFFFPPMGIAVLCGAGDWLIRRKTGGIIRKMDPDEKRQTIWTTIIGSCVWAGVIALLVFMIKGFPATPTPLDSTPFGGAIP